MKVVAWKLLNEDSLEYDKILQKVKELQCEWIVKKNDLFYMLFIDKDVDLDD